MRIAQVTYSTKPRGGVVHTLALSEALARRGHDVTVWTLGRGGDRAFFRDVDPSVRIRVVPFEARDGEDVGTRIQRSIETMRLAFASATASDSASSSDAFDVVHAQDCISANAVGPCIRTIHHLDEFTTPQLVTCHDAAIREPIARICVSDAVAREVAEGWGLRPTVIPNGVDAARFAAAAGPDGASARARWHEQLGDYVLALGGIEPRKGSVDLVEAFAQLASRRPDLRLVFGGGETLFDYRPYRAAFEAKAAELGLTPTILGVVDESLLAPLVAAASALAFVSTKEGFGLAAMEALAAGVPVVARDLPVLHEVFGDTVAYASTPSDISEALDAAIAGDGPTPEAGRALAASHDWDDVARLHEAFYASVAKEGDHGEAIHLPDHHLAR